MMAPHGVFIRTNRNDGEFRKDCLKQLSILTSAKNICSINRDDSFGGFKVYFKDSITVSNVLKRKELNVEQERLPVYPLATTLIVHAGPLDFNDEFENVLRNALSHLGPVSEVKKIPFCIDFPDIYTGDWKVVLEVPEIEDLEIFTENGFPDRMVLKLPESDEECRVTFYCSFCNKEGHTLQRCSKNSNNSSSEAETQSRQIDSLSSFKNSEPSRMSPTTSIKKPTTSRSELVYKKPSTPINISTKNIESIASKIGEEAVKQQLINSGHREQLNNIHLSIKQELNADSVAKKSFKRSVDDIEDGSGWESKPKKTFTPSTSLQNDYLSNEDTQFRSFSEPGCSFDADVVILREKLSPMRSSISSSNFTSTSRSNSVDESGQVTTSSLLEGMNDLVKSELQSTDENDSDSNSRSKLQTPRPVQRRKKPTQFRQITIPEGIKDIIRQNQAVLDEHQLEAFFNHVKKKACPSEVAKNFTTDLKGLKDQLQCIKDQYYRTPIIHTADEKYFMKWFANVLDRFDRKPTKRIKK